ncbi:MAG: GNAT family N-acetyltransferase [Proteobacteria bacterium]|nr:GNAT family N-acetyltransferase [Pseudomonadota bacterium]MBI3498380.1 GNAT family N-acetyltransferase [Pseudomonadota bacterium]
MDLKDRDEEGAAGRGPGAPAVGEPERDLVIRAAELGDCEGIAALWNLPKFRWGTLRLPFRTAADVRKAIEAKPPTDLDIVAIKAGVLVGQAGIERRRGRRQHAGEIGMGVHDAYRGNGIGTALLEHLIDAADRWLGLQRLELEVYTDNAPAIGLYRKFGFTIEGTHRALAFRDGVFADAYSMARLVRI